ncbi:MAG: glycerol-3-phosphate 1-O-acyltransferase PlsY [Acidimicrobiia bacterium]|jgi:acyl phosphate:glycerol-3-phosphate acyltransferase
MPAWLALASAYLIGSVDFAVIVARAKGVDIHAVGSGNPGASNVARSIGRGAAATVLVGDLLKGVIAAAMGWMAGAGAPDPVDEPLALAAGFLAVLGHCYPVFHRFRGGRGVATSGGVLLFVVPIAGLVAAGLWAIVVKLTRVAAIASLTVAVAAVPLAIWQGVTLPGLWWLLAMCGLVVIRHIPNIRRMIRGTEHEVSA